MVVVVQPKAGTVTRWRRTYEVENDHHHQRTHLDSARARRIGWWGRSVDERPG